MAAPGRATPAPTALLLVTPYYNKPTQAGVVAHCRAVADVTDLPVMLYDIPGRTGIPFATETLARARPSTRRIRAVKDAKGDLWASTKVMADTDLLWFSGDDALNLPAGSPSAPPASSASSATSPAGAVRRDDRRRRPRRPRRGPPTSTARSSPSSTPS